MPALNLGIDQLIGPLSIVLSRDFDQGLLDCANSFRLTEWPPGTVCSVGGRTTRGKRSKTAADRNRERERARARRATGSEDGRRPFGLSTRVENFNIQSLLEDLGCKSWHPTLSKWACDQPRFDRNCLKASNRPNGTGFASPNRNQRSPVCAQRSNAGWGSTILGRGNV